MPEKFADYKKVFYLDINMAIYNILLRPNIQQEIIEYNQSQLSAGVDSRDEKIITISAEEQGLGNVYALDTIASRAEQGLQTRNVDLKVTGQFWSTFRVRVTRDSFEVIADFNSPGEDIRNNFDNDYDFLGLTPDNLESFVWQVLYRELEIELPKQLEQNASQYLR